MLFRSRLLGDADANTLTGTANDDFLAGISGDDILQGLAGNDELFGGAGNDTINGGDEDDVLIGDSGNDTAAARAAGCPVWVVPYGYNEGHPVQTLDCDGIVSSLQEAAQRLLAQNRAGTRRVGPVRYARCGGLSVLRPGAPTAP